MAVSRAVRSVWSVRRRRVVVRAAAAALAVAAGASDAAAQSLRGSAASLTRQNREARRHDFSYLRTPAQLRRFVSLGLLAPVVPTRDFDLKDVSFPYARPEAKLFVERLAAQYRQACGEKLVVTSLTRPRSHQPRNASPRSVHPTGMAIDLRRSRKAACRRWLEGTLVSLEAAQVLEATRERRPPHYHIAVFPNAYRAHVARLTGRAETETRSARAAAAGEAPARPAAPARWRTRAEAPRPARAPSPRASGAATAAPAVHAAAAASRRVRAPTGGSGPGRSPEAAPSVRARLHVVQRRDTLWGIARRHGTTPAAIQRTNRLRSTVIRAGQVLRLPGGPDPAAAAARGAGSRAPAARPAPPPAPTIYIVRRRDTLWAIARRHGTTPAAIRRVNGLRSSTIHPGLELRLPADARF